MSTSDVGVTAHVADKYLPEPEVRRDGIGLCRSGGGYRAALFHLGALKRLNEFGVLAKRKTISSVAGGSIISAYLATRMPRLLTLPKNPPCGCGCL